MTIQRQSVRRISSVILCGSHVYIYWISNWNNWADEWGVARIPQREGIHPPVLSDWLGTNWCDWSFQSLVEADSSSRSSSNSSSSSNSYNLFLFDFIALVYSIVVSCCVVPDPGTPGHCQTGKQRCLPSWKTPSTWWKTHLINSHIFLTCSTPIRRFQAQ